jgi:hypothetical protein
MSHKLSDNANFPMSRPFASGVLGEFEYLLITAAARLGEDAYGAVIRREIEEATGRRRSIGALYTTLDRLQTKGSKTWMGEATALRGGRRFFIFHIPRDRTGMLKLAPKRDVALGVPHAVTIGFGS